ncbi:MAG: polysaccharide biosynthesis tyrosine autokinase [Gammaproteobacteria bacterium]|nr:polysaccharide biosynthesis tyrosine autokinase [Gammaproteobacteria bacterium]
MNDWQTDKRQMASWEQPAGSEGPQQTLPLTEYLQLLWYRKKLILAITVFVAIVGWIHVNQIRSIYTASSTLLLGGQQTQPVEIDAVLKRDYWGDQVLAEMEVLKSRNLARKVVERLKLQNVPEFNPGLREPEEGLFDFLDYLDPRRWIPQSWKDAVKEAMGGETRVDPVEPPTGSEQEDLAKATATNILKGKIKVEEVEFAGVVIISVSSWDRNLAARIANEYPEAYIVDKLEARFEATEKANTWLSEQLAELETKVGESERAVEIFRDERGLGDVAGGGLLDRQLSELNSQLIVARAELAEIGARLEQIRLLNVGNTNRLATMTEVLSSPMIQQLRSQELEVLARQSELSLEFGPRHPRMLQVQAELGEIRERIELEVSNLIAGLENEADFARARITQLEAGIREVQGEFSEINQDAVQLRALEREAAANRALFETFLSRFKETSSTQGLETSDARVLSQAEVPGGPSYPNRRQQLTSIVLMGFLGACGLVIGLHFLNPGLRSPEQIRQSLGEYVLGVIPLVSSKAPMYDYVIDKPQSGAVEALNSLKFSLALSDPDIEMKAVQITSSVPEEGKTSLALSLARVEAASGKRVILVDGDLRRSSILRKLGMKPGHKGLSDLVVAGDVELEDYILRDEKGRMDIMPIGTAEYANAGDIFSSLRMEHILGQLKERYDLVVVDAPPVMAVADARIIGRLVDKTLFVVRWNKTPGKVARAALEQLQRFGTDVAGIVLQQVDLQRYGRFGHGESGYYYHYGHYDKYYSS